MKNLSNFSLSTGTPIKKVGYNTLMDFPKPTMPEVSDSERSHITEQVSYVVFGSTPNNPPVADDQSVTTSEDTAESIILTASDVDEEPLTYDVVSPPAHGTLSDTAPALAYTPDADYYGEDNFTFNLENKRYSVDLDELPE